MDTQELSKLISQHLAVPHGFYDVVKWARSADEGMVSLKADCAVYLPKHTGLAAVAYLVNKSGKAETVLGCAADLRPYQAGRNGWAVAQQPPPDLALGLQSPVGLRLESRSFARLLMFFAAPPVVQDWARDGYKSDPHATIDIHVEMLAESKTARAFLFGPDGLGAWITAHEKAPFSP
jgi:hypothetical protein